MEEKKSLRKKLRNMLVLILIVMKDTHGAAKDVKNIIANFVLILIVMKDTHGVPI